MGRDAIAVSALGRTLAFKNIMLKESYNILEHSSRNGFSTIEKPFRGLDISYTYSFSKLKHEFKESKIPLEYDETWFADNNLLCFYAKIDQKVVHWFFVALHRLKGGIFLNRTSFFGKNSAYILAVETLPFFRKRGVAKQTLSTALKYLYLRGIKQIYVIIKTDNIPSFRLFSKLGFKKTGRSTNFELFGVHFLRCKGETPEEYKKISGFYDLPMMSANCSAFSQICTV